MSGPTGEHVHGPGCGHQLDLTKEHIHTGDDCCKTQLLTEIKVTHEVAGAAEWDAVGLVDPVGGGAIVTYTNSVVPVTVALNHGGVSGEPSFQPQVLISTGVTERGAVTYVGSPAIDAQRYSGGPDPSSFTVAGGAINAGAAAWSSMAVIEGLAQTSQHDSAVHGAGVGMGAVATTASSAPSSSGGVAFAQSAPSTGAEAAVNQAGAALQGYQPRVSASYGISDRSTVASLDGTGVISPQYRRGGEFNHVTVAGLQTIGVPGTWGASAAGINPGQPSQQRSVGYGAVSERDTVAGSVGTTSSATVSSSITPSSGAVASSQQARTWTAGASSTFGAPNPPGPSPADSSAVSRPLQRQIALREEPQAAVSSSRTVESPAMRAATGELRSPRSASVSGLESTASARVNTEESRGGARRFDGAAADRQAQSRYAREKAESSESRAELQKRADTPLRQTEAQTAAVRSERFMGWASERTTAVKTTGPSESSPPPMGQGVRLPGPSAEVRSQGTARENDSPNRATGERRDTRVTAATERASPDRLRSQPEKSPLQRGGRIFDGAQTAAAQREPVRAAPSVRHATETTLRRGESPTTRERVVRREPGHQDRASSRQDVGIYRVETRGSRIAERRDPRATVATERMTPDRVRPQPENSQLKREGRNFDGAQAAAAQREPARAVFSVRHATETTLRRGESPATRERVVRRETGNQDRTSGRQDGGMNRAEARVPRNAERRDPRAAAATERESPGRVRPQPDNSQFKREARNLDGAQAAAVQRGLTRDTPSARNAAGNTLSRERAPGSQERLPRRESGSQERAGARREVSGNSRGVGESRVLRDVARNGDRATGRPVNTVQPDRLSKRSDVTTRSAEPRVRVERVTRMSRSGVQGREVLKLRAAALRQAILERINRIVATAEQRLRRSNNTSLSSIRQLDLVTRVIEVLGEEEYEGILELRSRVRNPSSGTRIARRRKMPKTQDVDQKKPRLKSLKALKKQRAARVAGAGASTSQSGASQGAGGVTAGGSSAPSTVPGKIVSASRGGPSKSLDIFQAKSDDSEAPPND